MASGSKRFSDLQRLSFAEKLAYLRQLPEHRMAQGSEAPRKFDVGTRRPWTDYAYRGMASYVHPSIEFLLDELAEGKEPIDIAFLARREYADTLAMCRIARWMEREMEMAKRLTREQQEQQKKRKEQVLAGLAKGYTVKQAAKAAGADYSTVFDWRKADPEFEERYKLAMGGRLGRGRWKKVKAEAQSSGEHSAGEESAETIYSRMSTRMCKCATTPVSSEPLPMVDIDQIVEEGNKAIANAVANEDQGAPAASESAGILAPLLKTGKDIKAEFDKAITKRCDALLRKAAGNSIEAAAYILKGSKDESRLDEDDEPFDDECIKRSSVRKRLLDLLTMEDKNCLNNENLIKRYEGELLKYIRELEGE